MGNIGLGEQLVKWLMLIFNLLFWVSGIGLIIAGALAQTVYSPYLSFVNYGYVSGAVLLIVMGAIITIIAFFGCCGATKEHYCMLMTFAVLLGVIFIVELAGGIAGYVERSRVNDYLGGNMQASLPRYNATAQDAPTNVIWDSMQADMKCCGVGNWTDWKNARIDPLPMSCCRVQSRCDRNETTLDAKCGKGGDNVTECPIYEEGCLPKLGEKLRTNIGAIGGVGVGVAFIQLIGIALACCLARGIRRGYKYPG